MKIAIIGAGEAAKLYIERFLDLASDNVECFTSDGGGKLHGLTVDTLSHLQPERFDRVVVCSQFVDEIIGTLQDSDKITDNIHIFDVKRQHVDQLDIRTLTYVKGKTLYAYYRLSCMSLAFNYACFVNNAQVYAKHHQYEKIVFIVASGRFSHVNYGGSKAYSAEQQFWRLSNLLPMISQLAEDYCSFLHFDDESESEYYLKGKEKSHIFPENAVQKGYFTKPVEASYTIGPCLLHRYYNDVQSLKSNQQALDYIRRDFLPSLGGKKIVTITLRETTLFTNRNSNIEEWQKFSIFLLENGYQPVVIRDTAKALREPEQDLFPGAVFFSSAAFNIHLRTALFELAFINMGTDSGAIALALFMKEIKFCFFFVDTEDAQKTMTHEINNAKSKGATTGLEVGKNYPFLSAHQKIVWKDENFDNIVEEFRCLT